MYARKKMFQRLAIFTSKSYLKEGDNGIHSMQESVLQ